jgi:hypothetical protein
MIIEGKEKNNMSGKKYCPNCGKELESYVKICDYCGAKLEEKGWVYRTPGEPEKVASFCLLCIGIPFMIISILALIDFLNDPEESGEALGRVMFMGAVMGSFISCILPGIILYLCSRKEKKNT